MKLPRIKATPRDPEQAVIDLMADGRLRTCGDIVTKLKLPERQAQSLLCSLAVKGKVRLAYPPSGDTPSIWVAQ